MSELNEALAKAFKAARELELREQREKFFRMPRLRECPVCRARDQASRRWESGETIVYCVVCGSSTTVSSSAPCTRPVI